MVSLSTQQTVCPSLSITSQQGLEQMFWIFSEVFELNGEHQHLAALNSLWTLCLIWLVNTELSVPGRLPGTQPLSLKKHMMSRMAVFCLVPHIYHNNPYSIKLLFFSPFYWKAPACVFLCLFFPCYRVASIQSPNKNTRLTHQIKCIKMEADFSLASRFISLGWNTSKQKPSFELQQQNKAIL